MSSTRREHGGDLRARVALGALVLTVPILQTEATADGEVTPLIGASVVGASGPERGAELVGFELEAAWWRGRLGVALESAVRWNIGTDGPRSSILGGSARIRLFECLLPSLVDPRDIVELGIEAHGIVEHAWWDTDDATSYGLGLAARLRGGGDDPFFSTLLAESRVFIRVMSSRRPSIDVIARTTAPPTDDRGTHELMVLFGIGASFGNGEPSYVQRFHTPPFDSSR
jgi:hypothetical protein